MYEGGNNKWDWFFLLLLRKCVTLFNKQQDLLYMVKMCQCCNCSMFPLPLSGQQIIYCSFKYILAEVYQKYLYKSCATKTFSHLKEGFSSSCGYLATLTNSDSRDWFQKYFLGSIKSFCCCRCQVKEEWKDSNQPQTPAITKKTFQWQQIESNRALMGLFTPSRATLVCSFESSFGKVFFFKWEVFFKMEELCLNFASLLFSSLEL